MEKLYTPEEILKLVNESAMFSNLTDNRMKSELSLRRLRDYGSKGLISKPVKKGRNVFYTDDHLEEILLLRKIQSSGISDKTLMTYDGNPNDVDLISSYVSPKNSNKKNIDDLESTKLFENMKESFDKTSKTTGLNLSLSNCDEKEDLIGTLRGMGLKTPENVYTPIKETKTQHTKSKNYTDIKDFLKEKSYKEYEIEDGFILKIEENFDMVKLKDAIEKIIILENNINKGK